MKKGKILAITGIMIIIIIVIVILIQRNNRKKLTREFIETYKDGTVYVYENADMTGKSNYYKGIQQSVVLANKEDIGKREGMIRIVAVNTIENGKNYTRKINGYIAAELLK